MSIQKLLPLARKMGEENFLAYKQYMKSVKAGKSANLSLNLKNTTIIDTLSFTERTGEKADIDGFRNLLREIHKKYFPHAGSDEAIKKVNIKHNSIDDKRKSTTITTETFVKDSIIGKSEYVFTKLNDKLVADVRTFCEDFSLKFSGVFKLKNNNAKNIQNTTVNLPKGFKIDNTGEEVSISLNALATPEVPIFELDASISKEKFESLFGDDFKNILPDLIKKSGMKFD